MARKHCSTGHHYPICVFASFLKIISNLENKWKGRTTFESVPMIVNVSRQCTFKIHNNSRSQSFYREVWEPQKVCFNDCRIWLWGAPNRFLLIITVQHVCLWDVLRAYLFAKTNGKVAQRLNRNVWLQTWSDFDFPNSMCCLVSWKNWIYPQTGGVRVWVGTIQKWNVCKTGGGTGQSALSVRFWIYVQYYHAVRTRIPVCRR